MENIYPELLQYAHFVEISTIVVAIIILISSLDDFFVDLIYWALYLSGATRAGTKDLPDFASLDKVQERPIAIMLPAWKEHGVIFSMLASNARLMLYKQAHYFVGVYQNDDLTRKEVLRAQKQFPNITLVVVPRDGPTSKADCLNEIIARIFMFEVERKIQFVGIVMHDAEDLIHPHEMMLFNVLVRKFDFIQLPVFSFACSLRSVIAGVYMDEFAEMHTKDLEVRQHLSGVIPCAGVSACFGRHAILKLLDKNHGEAFRTSSFTEDYDIAFRVSELGFRSAFICFDADYTIDIDVNKGLPSRIPRKLPVATREFFPSELEAAYRQRARWLLGIVFQGTKEHGWKGSWGTKYFLMRDRKGLVTNPVTMMAYFLLANLVALEIYFNFIVPAEVVFFPVLSSQPVETLFACNFIFLVWRLGNKMIFTARIYSLSQAMMSAPRAIVGSFVNFFATWRAVRIYLTHRISGKPLVWDKTSHSYPTQMSDLSSPAEGPGSTGLHPGHEARINTFN
jgi:adsorption protein B